MSDREEQQPFDLVEARTRWKRSQVELTKLRRRRSSGDLVDREALETALRSIAGRHVEIVRSFAGRHVPGLAGEYGTSVHGLTNALQALLEARLNHLADLAERTPDEKN